MESIKIQFVPNTALKCFVGAFKGQRLTLPPGKDPVFEVEDPELAEYLLQHPTGCFHRPGVVRKRETTSDMIKLLGSKYSIADLRAKAKLANVQLPFRHSKAEVIALLLHAGEEL